jgi:hypothetical protein
MTNGAGGHGRKTAKAHTGKKAPGKSARRSAKVRSLVPAALRKGAMA